MDKGGGGGYRRSQFVQQQPPQSWLVLPPLLLAQARFSFRGQKCGNMQLPCLDNPRYRAARTLPEGTTCCRHQPNQPLHDYQRASKASRPAYTPEHKSTWNYPPPLV